MKPSLSLSLASSEILYADTHINNPTLSPEMLHCVLYYYSRVGN